MGRPPRHPPRSPEMMAHLTRALLEDPRVNGRLHHVQPMGQEWSGIDASFLSGTWSPAPDGESVTPADVDFGRHAGLYRRGVEEGPPAPGPGRVVLDRLERDWQWVLSVCRAEMCHGDLHMSNVVSRTPPPEGRALLIDYTPQAMPWAFEAAYCQMLNSIDRQRVGYTGLVAKMAAQRTAHGPESCPPADLPRLSTILLAWYALRQWPISPYRHVIPDYVHEIRRYIEESAALSAS